MLRKMRRSEVMAGQDPAAAALVLPELDAVQAGRPGHHAQEDRRDRGADVHAVVEDQAWRHSSRSPSSASASDVVARAARKPRPAAGGRGVHQDRTAAAGTSTWKQTPPAELEPMPDSVAPLEFSLTAEPVAPPKPQAAAPQTGAGSCRCRPCRAVPPPVQTAGRAASPIETPAAGSPFSAVTRTGPVTEPGSASAVFPRPSSSPSTWRSSRTTRNWKRRRSASPMATTQAPRPA